MLSWRKMAPGRRARCFALAHTRVSPNQRTGSRKPPSADVDLLAGVLSRPLWRSRPSSHRPVFVIEALRLSEAPAHRPAVQYEDEDMAMASSHAPGRIDVDVLHDGRRLRGLRAQAHLQDETAGRASSLTQKACSPIHCSLGLG